MTLCGSKEGPNLQEHYLFHKSLLTGTKETGAIVSMWRSIYLITSFREFFISDTHRHKGQQEMVYPFHIPYTKITHKNPR